MYCSLIDIEIQPAGFRQAKELVNAMLLEYRELGCKQFIPVDKGEVSARYRDL